MAPQMEVPHLLLGSRTMSLLSVDHYLVLECADISSNGDVSKVLNANGMCSWTVCPKCGSDDFTHVEGCEVRGMVPSFLDSDSC